MRSLEKPLILKVSPKNPDRRKISYCADVLRSGGLVAFPTETVYGVAANFLDKRALERLYEIKKRPKDKPLTIHISDLKMIKKLGCRMTSQAKALTKKFWPGPLTIILNAKGGGKLGFRMPANRIALALIEAADIPIAAPSANVSGHKPPKSGEDVLRNLGGAIDVLIDGGMTNIGIESTVVDLTLSPAKILRIGAVGKHELMKALKA